MRRRFFVIGLSVGSVMVAQGCGGSTADDDGGNQDGSMNDGTLDVTPQNDAGSDVTVGDDTGTPDTGPPDSSMVDASDGAPDTGSTGINTWACGNATVSNCTACIGHTMPCVYCGNMDASALSGVCVITGGGCGASAPMGYNLCRCSGGDAGICPEGFQVCLNPGGPPTNDVCDTCGAVTTTNGLTCENGGKCDAVDGGCL